MKPISLIKLTVLLCGLTLVAVSSASSKSPQAEEIVKAGQKIVVEKCSSCHSFDADKPHDPVELARAGGPPLYYAGNKFRQSWLEKWLAAPTRIRPAGYLPFRYVTSTPAGDKVDESLLPDHMALPAAEAKQVAAYLATLKKEVNPFPPGSSEVSIRAETHFEKILGCASCHQARPGHGGISGPELYSSRERLDRDWASAFLTDPLYWSIGPMPKLSIRSDQLTGISDYLFQAPLEGSAAPATTGAPKPAHAAAPGRALPTGRAELLYQIFCTQCHGIQGNGKGINAPSMFVAPRNHTSFEEMSMLTDDRLFAVIKFGGAAVGKSALMPSWSAVIKDPDISLLVDYLRTLSNTRAAND